MTTTQYVLTPGGAARLQRRLAEARAAYQAVCDSNPEAAESGDSSVWHDNFAFEENQRQMHMLARQVRALERLLSGALVVALPVPTPSAVTVGCEVVVSVDGEERTCWIAGYDDGAPERGRISYNSPLGRALIGAEPGEDRAFTHAGRNRRVEVIDLRPADPRQDCERAVGG